MKISDYKEWDNEDYLITANRLIENGGICDGIPCGFCPFYFRESIDKTCRELGYSSAKSTFEKDEVLANSAKEFKKMVEEEKEKKIGVSIENKKSREEKVEKDFKVGDKVKYINKENVWFGKIGKVISVYVSTCFVNFDDEIVECYKENLEKIEDSKVLGCVRIDINDCIDWEATRKLNKVNEELKEEPNTKEYMVFNPKGNASRKIHTSLESAKKEVERLINIQSNQEFYILEIVKKAKGSIKVEWEK